MKDDGAHTSSLRKRKVPRGKNFRDRGDKQQIETATRAAQLEAPEFVHPKNERSVVDSLASMDETMNGLVELRPLFEEFDGDTHKFPHPFFGDLSAVEWLALCGGHKARHLKQINNLAEKIG